MKAEAEASYTEAIGQFGRNQPNVYRILVSGKLSSNWSPRLCNLRIHPLAAAPSGEPITLLEGMIADQAQLSGVLNTLHDFHLSLLEVKLLSNGQFNEQQEKGEYDEN